MALASTLALLPACSDDAGQDSASGPDATATTGTAGMTGTTAVTTATTSPGSSGRPDGSTSAADSTSSSGTGALDTSGSDTQGASSSGAGSTGSGGPDQSFDCNDAPESAVSFRSMNGARGYHGLAITPEGQMIGSDGSSLIEASSAGLWSVFIPGIGSGEQMDWLADGDLAHSTDDGAITRIRLDGTTEIIAPSVFAYGVTRGPDDMLYVAPGPNNSVSRIDPATGSPEVVFSLEAGDEPHSLGFSPDGRRIYVGTIGSGIVYYVDLDESMNPTSEPMILSDQVGEVFGDQFDGWHDAVAVDACGNLYIPNFFSGDVYRVMPDGTTNVFWDTPQFDDYPHGFVWGTGEHGWVGDALYFPQPYNDNSVGEIVVGVPPRDFEGAVLNAVPMRGQ